MNRKILNKITRPLYARVITKEEAHDKGMRLVIGKEGAPSKGAAITFYFLIDEEDGVIADISYQAFGTHYLIAASEAASELLLRKNINQAARMGADLIEQHLREKKNVPSMPENAYLELNMVISAVFYAKEECSDLILEEKYETTPISYTATSEEGRIEGFDALSNAQQLKVIEEVVDKEIRPYIELDAGGITIHEFTKGELFISYQGACTSCYASVGSTLSAIQNILRSRVSEAIIVTPILNDLS